MGGLPIAFALGQGSELRQPLGLVVVGGLVVSQSLTLFITPVIFLYLEWLRTAFGQFIRSEPASAEAHAGAHVASQPGE
jgi:hydrophobic/amphiphilic exporter-1 (mainly G- bacteria), HAE1 family